MSNIARIMQQAAAGAAGEALAIEDVFSTYLYTGNDSTQTITNGIDLAGEGGLVWIKGRSSAKNNALYDTERGVNKYLYSNSTLASTSGTNMVTAFNSNGFSIGSNALVNEGPVTYASWTFRKAERFFDVVTYTGNGTTQAINHNLGSVPGVIITKRTDSADDWTVYHRSEGATRYGFLHLTNAFATSSTRWNNTDPTDTQFFLGNDGATNGSGGSFVAYLFAHDPLGPSGDGSDGLIACGSYTGNGSADGPTVTLGWEPQWVLFKKTNSGDSWSIIDNMRGFVSSGGPDPYLFPNSSGAEGTLSPTDIASPTATGFKLATSDAQYNSSGGTYIYIAIRRGPMREPTSGTEVFAIDTYASSAANAADVRYYSGFPVDFTLFHSTTGGSHQARSRLTGGNFMNTDSTASETSNSTAWYASNVGVDPNTVDDTNIPTALRHMFRRAPGFFDVVAYTGVSGADTINHNLGVVPEMIWVKSRTEAVSIPARGNWVVYHKDVSSGYLNLHDTVALQTADAASKFGNGSTLVPPTDTNFTVADDYDVGRSANNYIAYLFATLPGVSKVGSYTGTGASDQVIDCGFTTGARFVMLKRTDSTSNWRVWDTARGIVVGNDPSLDLNNTSAENTGFDQIDPDASGFKLKANDFWNTSGAQFIFLAIA